MRQAKVFLLFLVLMGLVAFPVHAVDFTVSAAQHATLGKILTGRTG